MPDETTFELASVHFGAEPVAVFRFGYERFELRARLGPGNLEHAIAAAAEVAASVFAKWSQEALAFAQRVRAARGKPAFRRFHLAQAGIRGLCRSEPVLREEALHMAAVPVISVP